MSDSNEIIRKQVFGLLRAGHTIDIYGLSETLREHCPDLSLDELVRKVGETVADRGGSAMWHKPGQSG